MTGEELEVLAAEAARDLLAREGRPVPPAVVLPLPQTSRIITLPEFPDDDLEREHLLARFAAEVVRAENAPAFAFLAEALAEPGGEETPVDVLVVAFGAASLPTRVMAAPLAGAALDAFTASEELLPTAMPFLAPLQVAVAQATPPSQPPGPLQLG